MLTTFTNKTAFITGAASGFGLEVTRMAGKLGMNLVLVDVQEKSLMETKDEMESLGVRVLAVSADVSKANQMESIALKTKEKFGAPSLVFNNAGVSAGGLIWENSLKDWDWVIGVNVMGVLHGVRLFTPMMLEAAKKDPFYQGHIVNTASMAGLLNPPNMGIYNVSKHAVVSLTETLYQDLALVTDQVSASVLCPFFVSTGISQSHLNRPSDLQDTGVLPTRSQLIGQTMNEKAVSSGKVSALDVAEKVFEGVRQGIFYIYSHPHSLASVQTRMEDILNIRNPSNPFSHKPEIGVDLKKSLSSP